MIIKDYKIFEANSVLVKWCHYDIHENMHHIGIIYLVTLIDDDNKKRYRWT